MEILALIFIIIYAIDIVFLFFFGIHAFIMVFLSLRNKEYCIAENREFPHKKNSDYPIVTIQLPIFNEFYVAERLIHKTMKMDWPKSKLEIQILDDSTDETSQITSRLAAEYRKKGFNIKQFHRVDRVDHKAGALREGLAVSKGEFVAVFDADFLPKEDFLKKTVLFFQDEKVGMVQGRWGHLNINYNLLTRAQTLGIDGHFVVEQVARNANNLWINFNGTGGIWRKACILDAGNWTGDTLTEDFDLSYRAELKGWNFRYVQDVEVPGEIPPTMAGFKSQQFRWCKGSIQTAKKLLPRIMRAPVSWKIKTEALIHLTAYSVHPLMIVNILSAIPMLMINGFVKLFPDTAALHPALAGIQEYSTAAFVVFAFGLVLSVGTFGPMFFYIYAQKKLYVNWKRKAMLLPLLMMIGTGIAVSSTRAWLEAIFGKKSAFIRTPKLALSEDGKNKKAEMKKLAKYKVKADYNVFMEVFMGLICTFGIYLSIYTGFYWILFFLVLYGLGFFYVAFLTMFPNFSVPNVFKKSVFAIKN